MEELGENIRWKSGEREEERKTRGNGKITRCYFAELQEGRGVMRGIEADQSVSTTENIFGAEVVCTKHHFIRCNVVGVSFRLFCPWSSFSFFRFYFFLSHSHEISYERNAILTFAGIRDDV